MEFLSIFDAVEDDPLGGGLSQALATVPWTRSMTRIVYVATTGMIIVIVVVVVAV